MGLQCGWCNAKMPNNSEETRDEHEARCRAETLLAKFNELDEGERALFMNLLITQVGAVVS